MSEEQHDQLIGCGVVCALAMFLLVIACLSIMYLVVQAT